MPWWWVWLMVGAAGVVILAGLRWALADFVLDLFGSKHADWSPHRNRQAVEAHGAEPEPGRALGGGD